MERLSAKARSPKPAVWKSLAAKAARQGACHLVLLDPDKGTAASLAKTARLCEACGVDGLLVGGSTAERKRFLHGARAVYESVDLPVILFPGRADQVIPHADAILFMSLISGRNPEFLIRQQVRGAPLVERHGLEAVPTAYMLVEAGTVTSVERASRTRPLPRNATNSALAHALAAQYLGMQTIYLEAGSGAPNTVPDAMIARIAFRTDLAIIVGGGIRTPAQARRKALAGADFVVTGTVFEQKADPEALREMGKAIRIGRRKT